MKILKKNQTVFIRLVEALREFGITPFLIFVILAASLAVALFEGLSFSLFLPLTDLFKEGLDPQPHDPNSITGRILYAFEFINIEPSMNVIIGVIIALSFARQGAVYVKAVLVAHMVRRTTRRVQSENIRHIFLAGEQLFTKGRQGNFTNVILREASQVSNIADSGLNLIFYAILAVGYTVLMGVISWQLMLVCLPVYGTLYVAIILLSRYSYKIGQRVKSETKYVFSETDEVIRGIVPIKMRCSEGFFAERLKKSIETWALLELSYRKAKALGESAIPLIFVIGTCYLLFISTSWLGMDILEAGVFFAILFRFQGALAQYNSLLSVFERSYPSLEHIHEFRDQARESMIPEIGDQDFEIKHAIHLENLHYSYNDTTAALNGLNIVFPKGKMTALAGRSGSGKSTVVGILCKRIIPDSGRVIVDEVDLNHISTNSLRHSIGLVSQNVFLFHGSIRYNLTFGLQDSLSDEDLWKILKQAHADDFVRAIGGLESVLHENGEDLSGGQRQRLAFARALCQKPEVLILDEPTSALDPEAERAIQQGLNALPSDTTVIIIAHRLESIKRASLIYIMDQGKVIESGTHSELGKIESAYSNLFDIKPTDDCD